MLSEPGGAALRPAALGGARARNLSVRISFLGLSKAGGAKALVHLFSAFEHQGKRQRQGLQHVATRRPCAKRPYIGTIVPQGGRYSSSQDEFDAGPKLALVKVPKPRGRLAVSAACPGASRLL